MSIVLQLLLLSFVLGSVYSLFAVSLNLVWGISGVVNVGHGAVLVLGAYILWGAQQLGFSIFLSVPVVLAVSYPVFTLVHRVLLRALGEANIEFGSLLITWGASLVVVALIRATAGTELRKIDFFSAEVLPIVGVNITMSGLTTFLVAISMAAGLAAYVKFTYGGREMRAVGSQPELAAALGINVPATRARAFGLGITMALGAGMLFGATFVFYPHIGDAFIIKAVAIVLVAGLGKLWRTWLVGIGLAVAETFVQFIWSVLGAQLLAYLLLVVALLIRRDEIARLILRFRSQRGRFAKEKVK